MMKFFKQFVLLLLVLQLLSAVSDGKKRRLRQRSRRIQKSIRRNYSADSFNLDVVELVLNYCKAKKDISDRNLKTERCIQRTNDELDARCLKLNKMQRMQYCPEYVDRLVKKTANWEELIKEKERKAKKLKTGKRKAQCQSPFKTSVLYDPSVSICCGGQILNRPNPSQDCCNTVSPGMCCLGCCGDVVFSRTTHFCYQLQLFKKVTSSKTSTTTGVSLATSSGAPNRHYTGTDPNHGLNDAVVYENESKKYHFPKLTAILGTVAAIFVLTVLALIALFKKRYFCMNKHPRLRTAKASHELQICSIEEAWYKEHNVGVRFPAQDIAETSFTAEDLRASHKEYKAETICLSLNIAETSFTTVQLTPESAHNKDLIHLVQKATNADSIATSVQLNGQCPQDQDLYDQSSQDQDLYEQSSKDQDLYEQSSQDQDFFEQSSQDQDFFEQSSQDQGLFEQSSQDQDSLCREISLKIGDLPVTDVEPLERSEMSTEQFARSLVKKSNIADSNIAENYWKTAETQTMVLNESNMRDSLGKPFQGQFKATVNDRVIQLPHSDVVMTLPGKDLQENDIVCHVSSHTNISTIRKKFKLADNEYISSPVTEYLLRGVLRLKEYAVVKLPVCSISDKIRILRAESDQGAHEMFDEIHEVPRVNIREEGKHLDTFYLLSESKRFVFIYTKVFSVYLNVETGDRIDFQAHAYLFSGIKRCENDAIVTIALYITGRLSSFKDFHQKMKNDEKCARRKQVDKRELTFKRTLRSTDELQVDMDIDDMDKWGFVKHEVKKKRVSARDIVQCQYQAGFENTQLCWEIENKSPDIPGFFKGFVTIDHEWNTNGGAMADAAQAEEQGKVCLFTIWKKTTEDRRSRSSRSGSSSFGSSNSFMGSQESTLEEKREPERDGQLVRKELDYSTMLSYVDSMGRRRRHPELPKPVPELSKSPECSYDNLEPRHYDTNTL